MNKNIIGVTIAIILLASIIWLARPAPKTPIASVSRESGALTADESQYDFGRISMAAGKVKRAFKVKNTDSETVVISKMYTSCMCSGLLSELFTSKPRPELKNWE